MSFGLDERQVWCQTSGWIWRPLQPANFGFRLTSCRRRALKQSTEPGAALHEASLEITLIWRETSLLSEELAQLLAAIMVRTTAIKTSVCVWNPHRCEHATTDPARVPPSEAGGPGGGLLLLRPRIIISSLASWFVFLNFLHRESCWFCHRC